MGDGGFWKLAITFISVLGAAAIIYQLNQGTLVQTGASTFGSVINDAFAAAPNSPAGQAGASSSLTSASNPSGNPGGSNKSQHSHQFTVT